MSRFMCLSVFPQVSTFRVSSLSHKRATVGQSRLVQLLQTRLGQPTCIRDGHLPTPLQETDEQQTQPSLKSNKRGILKKLPHTMHEGQRYLQYHPTEESVERTGYQRQRERMWKIWRQQEMVDGQMAQENTLGRLGTITSLETYYYQLVYEVVEEPPYYKDLFSFFLFFCQNLYATKLPTTIINTCRDNRKMPSLSLAVMIQ